MLVRAAMEMRLTAGAPDDGTAAPVRLPRRLKPDRETVRMVMLRGLSTSRLFAAGDRKGVLKAAQRRSGRAFRLDVRQRVIVKALVARHAGEGAARGQALARHIAYLGRQGAGVEGARACFFTRSHDAVDPVRATRGWAEDRHHFRFIVSPEHGDRISDLPGYIRDLMGRMEQDIGEPGLAWLATCHFDTDQPHGHVLVRGRRADGRDLVIPRDYIAYGLRGRAQEAAQDRLGDLSRADAERRVWRETMANRFTGFDRRLLAAADDQGLVPDGIGGHDAWAALTRGRLRHLETLGLAKRAGGRYRLAHDLELRLRTLQLRQDIIRTLHQRQLETGASVQELAAGGHVRGRVVSRGTHDELGAAPWLIVRDAEGREHYARLPMGARLPALGRTLALEGGPRGLAIIQRGRSSDLGR